MKRYILSAAFLVGAWAASAQEITKELRSFNKIVVSPKVNLILEKGDHESIRLIYSGVTESKINIEVNGKTLCVYLDDARVTEHTIRVNENRREGIYKNVEVTAYVTYRDLKALEIRGNQELTCNGPLDAKKFKLKAYGENEINLASVQTGYFKTSLYGENDLKVKGGKADYQKYRLFGENKIDTQALKSFATITNIYGESKIKLNTQDELKVNSFGESHVYYAGNADINRGLIFGNARIEKLQ
ncbi:MAG TPA: DUF2807 domain-containing protein [Ohtaekwangia sp.]